MTPEALQELKTLLEKATPGPWSCVAFDTGIVIYDANNGSLGRVHHRRGYDKAGEANARLIAAAPDLLEVCKIALEHSSTAPAVRFVLQAAIQKAEGE